MHATWRPPPTAAGARSRPNINDRHGNDERGIRRWSSITLCRLRDAIIRASALSRSWVVLRRASPPRYPHGPPRPPVTSEPASSSPAAATAAASPSGGTAAVVMALTDLPYTIFADIVARLAPHEAVAARRTSRGLCAALTRPELCISLLLLHFPRARESRELRTMLRRGGGGGDATAPLERVCWADALAAVARRYHVHLGTATPRATQTLPLPRDAGGMLRGVTPWHRFLRLDDKTAAFHYWDPAWTCDADAGLLVHPVAGRRYALRDIEHGGRTWPVPFTTEGRLVRRVRMSHGILVFEWCEAQEEADGAHRHFATAYDVKRVRRRGGGRDGDDDFYTLRRYAKDGLLGGSSEDGYAVTFRAEWKIHSLGVALRHEDRFFSTHNSTHYAVYIWQPSRSPWADDEPPLERLLVWDLGAPPPDSDLNDGPRLIAQLTNTQLDHWGVRQRGTPSLRCLRLDDRTRDENDASTTTGHVFVVEEEHRWSAGPHSSPTPPRLHHVKTTGIPLAATAGPRWVDECGKVRPDSSASRMPFCGRHGPVPGEATTWPGRCPCWRHDDFPYLTVCEVLDAGAGVRFSARHCFMLETLSVHIRPRLRIHGVAAPTPTTTTTTAGTQRRRASSTKTSETSSSSSKRGKRTTGGGGEDKRRRGHHTDEDDAGRGVAAGSATSSDGSAATTREIQFADDAWARLLNAGYICGDERWLIGQDNDGAITIMHF